jgi:hypothetical protein
MDLALRELHEFTLVSQVSARHAFCFGLVQWISLTPIATACSLIHVHLDSLAVARVLVFCDEQLLLTIHSSALRSLLDRPDMCLQRFTREAQIPMDSHAAAGVPYCDGCDNGTTQPQRHL